MAAVKLKMGPKIILGIILIGLITLGVGMLKGKSGGSPLSLKLGKSDTIKVGVVTWGGYAGGQYLNGSFKSTAESRYSKEYGINVEYILMDDVVASRDAWKSGAIDVLWTTADSLPAEVSGLAEFKPKVIMQADWSRGGDAIVARAGINKVSDLRGKKVAYATATPSHSFLLWMLQASDMTQADIEKVEVGSAIDAAAYFKSGKVDAAVVWSPDDKDCVTAVSGSKILKSTKDASHIIADVFFAKEEYIASHREEMVKLVTGHLQGAAEINTSASAKAKAVEVLAAGLNQPADFVKDAIENTRLATLGDNLKFFGIDKDPSAVTGEKLYTSMRDAYLEIGVAKGSVPHWRDIVDVSIIKDVKLSGSEHAAEAVKQFTKASASVVNAEAFSTKAVSVSFATGSSTLNEEAKFLIKQKFGDIAKGFASARIRIEGNTDSVGSESVNKDLSFKRANAVAQFLASAYGFDVDRFIVKGNGSSKPIASNDSAEGRAKNRRTDFELVSE